jgi:hypothetical protein
VRPGGLESTHPVPQKEAEHPLIKSGTKILPDDLVCETVARRQRKAHVADSQRRRSPFQFGLRTVGMPSTLVSWFMGFRESGEYIMRNRVDIDSSHSRAIVREIGERLQSSLKEDRELPVAFRMQIERLRQLEGDAQANVLGPCRVNRGFRLRRMHEQSTA